VEGLLTVQTWLDASQLNLEISCLSQTLDAQIPFLGCFFFLLFFSFTFQKTFKITARVNLNGLIRLFA